MKSIYTLLILSFLATFGIADEITGLNLRTTAGSQAVNPTAVAGAVLSLDANKRPTFGGPLTFSAAGVATFAPALSGSQATSALDISPTWNTSGTPTALKVNVTDTASDASSKLLHLQVGGVSKFYVSKNGTFITDSGPNIGVFTNTSGSLGSYSGSTRAYWAHSGAYQPSNGKFSFSSGVDGVTDVDVILCRESAATLQLGGAASATPVAQTLTVQDASGANIAGADFTIAGSQSTGSATGGSIIFKTSRPGGGGSGGNTLSPALVIKGNGVTAVEGLWVGSNSTISNNRIFDVQYDAQVSLGSGVGLWWESTSTITGAPDLKMGRDSAATLQLGTDHATTPTAQTIKAHDVTTGTGASMTIAGGKGSVAGGDARIGTSVTNGAPNPRLLVAAAEKTLTESTATIVCNVTVAAGKYIGGELIVTTHADDATDFQAITEHLTFSAVNKGGTVTATIQAAPSTSTTAASAGTLTTAWTAVANGNSVDIKNDAASSLTQTTLKCSYQLRLNTDDTVTVTP